MPPLLLYIEQLWCAFSSDDDCSLSFLLASLICLNSQVENFHIFEQCDQIYSSFGLYCSISLWRMLWWLAIFILLGVIGYYLLTYGLLVLFLYISFFPFYVAPIFFSLSRKECHLTLIGNNLTLKFFFFPQWNHSQPHKYLRIVLDYRFQKSSLFLKYRAKSKGHIKWFGGSIFYWTNK